jgi:hypothetical protein
MPKKHTNVYLTQHTFDAIAELGASQGWSQSQAIQRLIVFGLEALQGHLAPDTFIRLGLPEDLMAWVDAQVSDGSRFSSPMEAICFGLRMAIAVDQASKNEQVQGEAK